MKLAVEQARRSLRQGNNGFGAVIVKGGQVIAQARDTEETDQDPTAHAEMNAIRMASKKLGKDLGGCVLIATHEPCPMCATAIAWSDIGELVFGYGIEDALKQGRRRIGIPCEEIFHRAGADVRVTKGCLYQACSLLYHRDVRREIKKLRAATPEQLRQFNEESAQKRLAWFQARGAAALPENPLEAGYRLLLEKFNIGPDQAPVVEQNAHRIVFHSKNFCPTLEACKLLDLDTRTVCRLYNEESTRRLVRQIDPRLRFSRNYEKLRPYSEYCEEMITRIEPASDPA